MINAPARTVMSRIASVGRMRPRNSTYIMATLLPVLGFFLIFPIILILGISFNTSESIWYGDRTWGLDNWRVAWEEPRIFQALRNTVMVWFLVVAISFPIATVIAWVLARTNIPMSNTLEVRVLGLVHDARTGHDALVDHADGPVHRHAQQSVGCAAVH